MRRRRRRLAPTSPPASPSLFVLLLLPPLDRVELLTAVDTVGAVMDFARGRVLFVAKLASSSPPSSGRVLWEVVAVRVAGVSASGVAAFEGGRGVGVCCAALRPASGGGTFPVDVEVTEVVVAVVAVVAVMVVLVEV
jgi:hypothetical protein